MAKYAILVVDDEAAIQRLLRKILEKANYHVEVATSGQEALEALEKADFDVLISDIKMPEMDGLALVPKVKQIDKRLPIILMTAFATIDTAVAALRLGVCDYILKPFDNRDVVAAVAKAIAGQDELLVEGSSSIKDTSGYLTSNSLAMQQVIDMVGKVAKSDATVMLYGETGTGKELAARGIHDGSARRNQPFIKVNCAAIPDNLLEAEFFGYERGAYTGAIASKPGRFEIADGGSLFLDEIGELPLALQAKLLRVLQEKTFERLGGTKTIQVDVRIIAATNQDLGQMVEQGRFREDLFYRLQVIPITLPPLRQRKEDIANLVEEFLSLGVGQVHGLGKKFTPEAMEAMVSYAWPGNVREMQNVIERCLVISNTDLLTVSDLPPGIAKADDGTVEGDLDTVMDVAERDAIVGALRNSQGNRSQAALELGISRRSLHRKLVKYQIS